MTPEENREQVNGPAHYQGDEAMRVIEKFGLGFTLGNAVKYILRAGKKPGQSAQLDLAKARWYIERELLNLQRKLPGEANVQEGQQAASSPDRSEQNPHT